jgi:hypothetical protein
MGTNKPDIILLWGDGPDLVIDLEGHATHHVNTLPTDLSKQMEQMDRNETSIKKIDQLQIPIESLGSAAMAAPVDPAPPAPPLEEQVASETVSIASPSQEDEPVALQVAEERPVESETVSIAPPSQGDVDTVTEQSAPTETETDEGLFVGEPVIPAPAPPVEESPQEPAVAFAGIVNDKPEVEEAKGEETVKIDLPAESEEGQEAAVEEAEEAPEEEAEEKAPEEAEEAAPKEEAQEAPAEAPAEEENEEWNEEVNQIQAAQPTLPPQPPSEQQISPPPPPAS